jgi:hypothetical protein
MRMVEYARLNGLGAEVGGVRRRVPTSVIVVVIVGFVYAGIDVLGTTANFLMYFLQIDLGRQDPGLEFLYHDAVAGVFTVVSALLTGVFTVWMAVGGVGSLQLRPWARAAMVSYAWTNLAALVILAAAHASLIVPRLVAQYPAGRERTVAEWEQVVQGLMMLVPLGLSAAILLIYRRRAVREAFAGRGAAAPRPFPVVMAGEEGQEEGLGRRGNEERKE